MNISPDSIETISPIRRRPNYKKKLSTHIAPSKEEALTKATTLHNSTYTVYSDGSGFENGIGAAAIMYINQVESQSLWMHLGPSTEHTVYEGELAGLCLALHILYSLPFSIHSRIIIGTDSQAAIKALSKQTSHLAHYLLDHIHNLAENLHDKLNGNVNIQIHWTPGHQDFAPNERADTLTKRAAGGDSSIPNRLPPFFTNTSLPTSIPATRQEHLSSLKKAWKTRWKKSSHYMLSNSIDKSLPSNKFLQLVDNLPRSHSAILTQLRTGHVPLN